MPSVRAASSALRRSREAIAVTSLHTPFCMPGMTFVTAIFAVLRIPQRTLDIATHHSRKDPGGKTCARQKSASGKFRSWWWWPAADSQSRNVHRGHGKSRTPAAHNIQPPRDFQIAPLLGYCPRGHDQVCVRREWESASPDSPKQYGSPSALQNLAGRSQRKLKLLKMISGLVALPTRKKRGAGAPLMSFSTRAIRCYKLPA
jgi:hypothetical protein